MSSDGAFLDAAIAIGRGIAEDAIWYGDRCTWMGASEESAVVERPEYRALGPRLYDGTAGVGLFLAHLAGAVDDATFRRTAAGALRHAAARAASLEPARRDGLHAGTAGIAWALAQGGGLLGDEALVAPARRIVAAGPPPGTARSPDLVGGAAGRIVGLLALAGTLGDEPLGRTALEEGEALLRLATVDRHGWSWKDPTQRYPAPLCGIAHGAAGIGLAFVELFAATGDERFREAAEGAFAYERSWLDPQTGTWPDLRVPGVRRGAGRPESPMTGAWCHGAPGIALTRLRAVEVLGAGAHEEDARIAFETTRRVASESLAYDPSDISLCHGASGPTDVLLCAGGDPVAVEVGAAALERFGTDPAAWPCGIPLGSTPSLFRGLSGIAWWLLRLHDRSTPSLLAVVPLQLTSEAGVA
jgi:lantibiotic biosynthesis protein